MDTADVIAFEQVALVLGAVLIIALGTKARHGGKRRRIWIRKFLNQRKDQGAHHQLLPTLRECDKDVFLNFLRLPEEIYLQLLTWISPLIVKTTTNWCEPLSPSERLTITLRFLATGDSYKSLQYLFRVSNSTISILVPETCRALYLEVGKRYMKCPSNKAEWNQVSDGFSSRWQLPHCLGAIDGKHIAIRCPPNSGSDFFNYKRFFSIVLMGVCDSKYKFVYVNVGSQGRISDGGVFAGTSIDNAINRNSSVFLDPEPLPGDDRLTDKFFVADDAFKLSERIMKPYAHRDLSYEHKIYNYRICHARRIIESSFGILVARFRVLLTTILLLLENATSVVLAYCALHNMLCDKIGTNSIDVDKENIRTGSIRNGAWRQFKELTLAFPPKSWNMTIKAKEKRDFLCTYFNSDLSKVRWQDKMINV